MTHQQSKLKPFLTFFLLLLFDKVSINQLAVSPEKTIGPSKSNKILPLIVSNNSKYSFKDTQREKEHIRKVEPRPDIFGGTCNPRPGILIVGPKTRDTYDTWDTRPETWSPYDK